VNYGGGARLYTIWTGGTLNVYNNIIWGNTAPDGGDIEISSSGTSNGYNNFYSYIDGSWDNSGNNNSADPLFVGGGDYHLSPTSPCIDAGHFLRILKKGKRKNLVWIF
jgi:hypothetical protein